MEQGRNPAQPETPKEAAKRTVVSALEARPHGLIPSGVLTHLAFGDKRTDEDYYEQVMLRVRNDRRIRAIDACRTRFVDRDKHGYMKPQEFDRRCEKFAQEVGINILTIPELASREWTPHELLVELGRAGLYLTFVERKIALKTINAARSRFQEPVSRPAAETGGSNDDFEARVARIRPERTNEHSRRRRHKR